MDEPNLLFAVFNLESVLQSSAENMKLGTSLCAEQEPWTGP